MSQGLYIVPILAVLILIHEFGHFFAARSVGVKVEEFGIGIPPRIKGWTRNGVLWSVNWIPFGGFVRVLGEDGRNMDPGSMNAKSPWQRGFFLVAGSAMNFLLAIVLIILVIGVQGIATSHVYIASVDPGSPAAQAGWQPGDRVVEVAGVPIESSDDVAGRAQEFAGRPMSVVVERGGKEIETSVTPRQNHPIDQGPTGVRIAPSWASDISIVDVTADSLAAQAGLRAGDRIVAVNGRSIGDPWVLGYELQQATGRSVPIAVERGSARQTVSLAVPTVAPDSPLLSAMGLAVKINPLFSHVSAAEVVPLGLSEAYGQTKALLGGIRDLVTGRQPLNTVAGPVGMYQATSELVQASPLPLWVTLAQISTLLSLNLGVVNLLPLPALDGGRLLFVLVEILRGGRRVAPEREGIVHLAGLVILVGLMVVIAVFDVGRILEGRSFLP